MPVLTRSAVVVTGASEGIGCEIAWQMAKSGHDAFVLIARSGDLLDKVGQRLQADFGVRVVCLAMDIGEASAADRIGERLADEGWHCEVLVNSAGVGLSGRFCRQPRQALAGLIRLNVEAPVHLMRKFLPEMCERGHGGVINVASLGGYMPGPGQAVYYASKAFLLSFSKAVHQEVWATGVHITAVAPGPVATRFHAKMKADRDRYRWLLVSASPGWVARVAVLGLKWNVAVIVPGPASAFAVIVTRLMPNFLLAPLMGWLLGRRGKEI